MKKHTLVYLKYFGMDGFAEPPYMPCEFCKVQDLEVQAVDVHHLKPRGMGGSKTKDYIENLMAACRDCHNLCESNDIPKEEQMQTHLDYLKLHS